MPKIVPINRTQFQDRRWLKPGNFAFAATVSLLPLVAAEFPRAALAMPIAFTQQDGQFHPVALLSPMPGRNLFIGPEGQWLGTYIPAALRSFPFMLARAEGTENLTLAIDEECSLIVPKTDPTGIDFFAIDGTPSVEVTAVFDFLREIERNRAQTQQACAVLAQAGLMQPWPLQVNAEGSTQTVNGLFRIDEAALAKLVDDSFLALRWAGALPLAYMQILSVWQLSVFERLSHVQLHLPKPELPTSAAAIEELFARIDPERQLFG